MKRISKNVDNWLKN